MISQHFERLAQAYDQYQAQYQYQPEMKLKMHQHCQDRYDEAYSQDNPQPPQVLAFNCWVFTLIFHPNSKMEQISGPKGREESN